MKAVHLDLEARAAKFKGLLEEFCAMAEAEGILISPYSDHGLKFYPKLPQPQQEAALAHFETYVEAAREVISQGVSLQDDQMFLWQMFKKLRAHAPMDFLSHLVSGEVIEIHNHDFIQIYRNMNFFKLCTYTIEDLICRPFWELYERDLEMENRLVEIATRVFKGEWKGVTQLDIPQHTILEKESEGRLLVTVQHRIAAPLLDEHGRTVAVLAAVRTPAHVRTSPTKPEISRKLLRD